MRLVAILLTLLIASLSFINSLPRSPHLGCKNYTLPNITIHLRVPLRETVSELVNDTGSYVRTPSLVWTRVCRPRDGQAKIWDMSGRHVRHSGSAAAASFSHLSSCYSLPLEVGCSGGQRTPDEPQLSPHFFTNPLPTPVTIDGKRTTLYDTSIPEYEIGRLAVANFGGHQYQFVLDSCRFPLHREWMMWSGVQTPVLWVLWPSGSGVQERRYSDVGEEAIRRRYRHSLQARDLSHFQVSHQTSVACGWVTVIAKRFR